MNINLSGWRTQQQIKIDKIDKSLYIIVRKVNVR